MDSLVDILMVFGPVYGYYSQYSKIKTEQSIGNFSIDVCAILLFANILRVLFWFGERYETPLLFQSLLMIVTQFILLAQCIKVSNQNKANKSIEYRDGGLASAKFWNKFWRWQDIRSYVESVITFTVFFTLVTLMFVHNYAAVQIIGMISAMIEATLGFPQMIKNYQNQNASGISYGLIGSWFLGDFSKTIYFIYKSAPLQFTMCGVIQLTVDILIILQMKVYKSEELVK
ncbi:PQ loop protein (macronuclear) [Tetrahymena thermophila SB210]|uniref:PQ loop protein n=1 Tax=Tetrahymena thermophila (strain SB210) TaxID=312017 RepID=I7M1Q1_TETTS|nr:PQ loop protein [Tetrahymena thermophila SB210]EAR97330.2 PQ loop protein [Tetrahymena thermophila SB210]|eukprot:XP_001017575.2 PQ loop protein [Tetrahymena thermophila SB210]